MIPRPYGRQRVEPLVVLTNFYVFPVSDDDSAILRSPSVGIMVNATKAPADLNGKDVGVMLLIEIIGLLIGAAGLVLAFLVWRDGRPRR